MKRAGTSRVRHLAGALLAALFMALMLLRPSSSSTAQTTPGPGDPPIAALISFAGPDEAGIVTITGAPGAVFPNADIAIRNLYTEQTVYTSAGINGGFSAAIYGPGSTPFWISPAIDIPNDLRAEAGSPPGGPGIIIYGSAPDIITTPPQVTQIQIDAALDDWAAYPDAALEDNVLALINRESLYLAAPVTLPVGSRAAITLTLDGGTYEIVIDPRSSEASPARQIAPDERDLGLIAAGTAISETGDGFEARIPLNAFAPPIADAPLTTARLDTIATRTDSGETTATLEIGRTIPQVAEVDGFVYLTDPLGDDAVRFSISGPLAGGSSSWSAQGRASSLEFSPGDALALELDMTFAAPDFPDTLAGVRLLIDLWLQPVAVSAGDDAGVASQPVAGLHTNNGWSNVTAASGLALDNLRGDVSLGRITIAPGRMIRQGDALLAAARFDLTLPGDLPAGVYVPVITGRAQIGEGPVFAWTDATETPVFGNAENAGASLSRQPITRLPLVLNVGQISAARLPLALLYENPSDGARGVIADEDRPRFSLSGRTLYPPQTFVLPPGSYPIEPYALNLMPNAGDVLTAPLIPLLFPGGRIEATITLPDGSRESLPSTPIAQDRISTAALDDADRFGTGTPIDLLRLTTLNPAFTDYPFDQYGEYIIVLTVTAEDVWGNRYEGGGTYRLLIAEPLDLMPGVLPGTPFEVGDALYAGAHLVPRLPADLTMTIREFPLEGQARDTVVEGRANRSGDFLPDGEAFTFETPGEYVIDYEARYTDPDGRLYAASLRAAGVVATPANVIVAHGRRGLADVIDLSPPAWFTALTYPPGEPIRAAVSWYPYHAGDVAVVPDGTGGLRPVIQAQDTVGSNGLYAGWLLANVPGYTSEASGRTLDRLAAEGSLPLLAVQGGPPSPYGPALRPALIVNLAYGYISAVRPGVSVRQFVQGDDSAALDLAWNTDDPYSGQIGAGVAGDRPGDVIFLFGGAVIRNADAGLQNASAYAALAVIGAEGEPARVSPPYRGAAGGPDGGPLLTLRGQEISTFFHPTAVRPGQVMTLGETLAIAGQVAPTVRSQVAVTVVSPSGTARALEGITSDIGYFYDPSFDFVVDEIGVWTIEVRVTPVGLTSAGELEPPLPTGGVLADVFQVYVLEPGVEPLDWQEGGDTSIAIGAGVPFNFSLTAPEWDEVRAYYTVSIPGVTLAAGDLPLQGRTGSYQFNRANISRDYTMVEGDGLGDGPGASDVVTLTFMFTGLDSAGEFQMRGRTFNILHDRVVSVDTQAANQE